MDTMHSHDPKHKLHLLTCMSLSGKSDGAQAMFVAGKQLYLAIIMDSSNKSSAQNFAFKGIWFAFLICII